jgi:hypothetical protein
VTAVVIIRRMFGYGAVADPVASFQEGLKSHNRRLVDRDDLNAVARKYLETPYLRSDLLEWIIVDAFVLYEIWEFGENLKQGAGVGSLLRYWLHHGRLGAGVALWSRARVLLILAGWIAGLMYVTPYAGEGMLETLLVFGAYVLFFMWLTGRPIFLERSSRGSELRRRGRWWRAHNNMRPYVVSAILEPIAKDTPGAPAIAHGRWCVRRGEVGRGRGGGFKKKPRRGTGGAHRTPREWGFRLG